MKTIVFNDTNESRYLLDDDRVVTIGSDDIQIAADADATHHGVLAFGVQDLDSSNCTLYTGVTPPDDWHNGKYLFDGTTWTANEYNAGFWNSLGQCSGVKKSDASFSSPTCKLYLNDHSEFAPRISNGTYIGFPEKCPACGADFNAPSDYVAPS